MSSKRTHNKSGQSDLRISTASQDDIHRWDRALNQTSKKGVDGPVGTKCRLINASDGRLTVAQTKVCYAYQLVAYKKFGAEAIANVTASKSSEDLVISHLCGTRNCIEPDHLVLEPKRINDERVHCHYCLQNIFRSSGRVGVDQAVGLGICGHHPTCGSTQHSSIGILANITNVERQKVGGENPLYDRKLQETPGKSLNTAAIGPTGSAAGDEETPPDRNNVRVGGTKRPGPCNPLGQSAAKLPIHCREPVSLVSDDEKDENTVVEGEERSTTIIDRGEHRGSKICKDVHLKG